MKTVAQRLLSRLLPFLALVTLTTHAQDKADQLAIIVGKSSTLDGATTAEIQRYFKADKTKLPDQTKVVILMQDVGRPERDAALKVIYKMSEAEYNDYFVGQTFTGAVASAPKSFPNPATVKAAVAQTPGAIAYIRASDVDDTVKAVKIDGKSPGDADYGLKMK